MIYHSAHYAIAFLKYKLATKLNIMQLHFTLTPQHTLLGLHLDFKALILHHLAHYAVVFLKFKLATLQTVNTTHVTQNLHFTTAAFVNLRSTRAQGHSFVC